MASQQAQARMRREHDERAMTAAEHEQTQDQEEEDEVDDREDNLRQRQMMNQRSFMNSLHGRKPLPPHPTLSPPGYQDVTMEVLPHAATEDFMEVFEEGTDVTPTTRGGGEAVGPGRSTAVKSQVPLTIEEVSSFLPDLALPVEDTTVFSWSIDNWSELKALKKTYSPVFECANSHWRILLFPNGNNGTGEMVSVYLESVEACEAPKGSSWHKCAQLAISMAHYEDNTVFKYMYAQHRYTPISTDWGFGTFCKPSSLQYPFDEMTRAIVEGDKLRILAQLRVLHDETGVLWHDFVNYDSKKETGYVGLKNQGATCYMNSLLQSFYFTNYFRRATYAIPTEKDEPTKSIPLALQRIFYQLQFSDLPVGTTELTKSFGWDTLDSFMQHDVQEFNRVLQDNLESKMKGTKAEGAISKLFVGKYKSYIRCINVDYESARIEDFYDIQLNVKGFKNMSESFEDYIAVETLDGDNKYMAEGYGLQDAKKGVIFTEFPPVLHLQLKRFEYDIERDAMVKINDRYEFPAEIDLTKYLENEGRQSAPQKYHLHGVLVHSGDLHGGHYNAFLRSEESGKWFKFDDDRVVPVTTKEVFEDNFGGEYASANPRTLPAYKNIKKFTNAYMLVYIKESDIKEILRPVTEEDIPAHLIKRFVEEKESAERIRKEREEQHLYISTKVLLDEHLRMHHGFDLCNFEDKAHPVTECLNMKIRKDETLKSFRARIGEQLNVDPKCIQISVFHCRQNKTLRPDAPLSTLDDNLTMEQVRANYSKLGYAELCILVQIVDAEKLQDVSPPCSIYIKYYDPVTVTMSYVGRLQVDNRGLSITNFIPQMLEMAQLPPNLPIKLFEEIKPEMIDILETTKTFLSAEIGDGDIICFQLDLSPQDIESLVDPSLASVAQYFDYIRHRLVVTFKHRVSREKETPMKDIELVLSKRMTYDKVLQKLGSIIPWNPLKIRLSSSVEGKHHLRRGPTYTLQEMLQQAFFTSNNPASVLYFELLDIELAELETKKFLKIYFTEKMKELGPFELLVPKTAKAHEVLKELGPKITLAAGGSGQLQLFEVSNFRLHRVFAPDDFISTIQDSSTVYAEEVPLEEKTTSESDFFINVFHFNKDPVRSHGIPFRFIVRKDEIFERTKERLVERLGLSEKEREREVPKMKFVVVSGGGAVMSKLKQLEDGDTLSEYDFAPTDHLGIDHIDKSGKSTRGTGAERAIKIFN